MPVTVNVRIKTIITVWLKDLKHALHALKLKMAWTEQEGKQAPLPVCTRCAEARHKNHPLGRISILMMSLSLFRHMQICTPNVHKD